MVEKTADKVYGLRTIRFEEIKDRGFWLKSGFVAVTYYN
jgi:hypothetical protein